MMTPDNIREKGNDILNLIKKKGFAPSESLMGGNSGIILFLSVYQQIMKEGKAEYEEFLEATIEQISRQWAGHTYSSGIAGFGWLLQYLKTESLLSLEVDEFLQDLDEVLYEHAMRFLQQNEHDLLYGGVGLMFYFLKREESGLNSTQAYLYTLIDTLLNTKRQGKWLDSDKVKDEEHKEKEIVNLSLSHGLANKIILLSALLKKNYRAEELHMELNKCVQQIMDCPNPNEGDLYPSHLVDGVPEYRNRLSWCHGDLGVCLSLLAASEALQDNEIKKQAIDIGLHTTSIRGMGNAGLEDACLCHGSSGLAVIYQLLYEKTGLKAFEESCEYWTEKTLELPFETYNPIENRFTIDYGLLNGISGIGLSLLSFVNGKSLPWSQCLLIH